MPNSKRTFLCVGEDGVICNNPYLVPNIEGKMICGRSGTVSDRKKVCFDGHSPIIEGRTERGADHNFLEDHRTCKVEIK